MATITIYNVGFGDCSLLTTEEYNLLVDYGSKSESKPQWNKAAVHGDIIQHIQQKQANYACVTHFHLDHMRYISALGEHSLDKLIAPNFFSMQDIEIELYALLAFPRNSPAHKFALNMLSLIPLLLKSRTIKPKGTLHFVSEGANLALGCKTNRQYRILNPSREAITEKVRSILDEMKGQFGTPPAIHAARGLYSTLFSTLRQTPRSDQNSHIANNADLIVQLSPESYEEAMSTSRDLLAALNDISYYAHNGNDDSAYAAISITHKQKNRMSRLQNQYSVVFDKSFASDSVLYLGDVSKRHFHAICKDYLQGQEYAMIKVSHHGTKSYFSPHLPNSKHLVVSSGEYRDWRICPEYPLTYLDRIFVCTNSSGCSFFRSIGHPCNCLPSPTGRKCICGFDNPDFKHTINIQ